MGVLGEMFPGPKIRDESSEAGDGEPWRLGRIDLENGVVEFHRAVPEASEEPEADSEADQS